MLNELIWAFYGEVSNEVTCVAGEGIHHAMECGKIAGLFLLEALAQGDYETR